MIIFYNGTMQLAHGAQQQPTCKDATTANISLAINWSDFLQNLYPSNSAIVALTCPHFTCRDKILVSTDTFPANIF